MMMFLFKQKTLILLLCAFSVTSLYIDESHAKELISAQCEPLIESSFSPEEIQYSQGLLWTIAKEGKQTSYLFGTIHVSDKEITTLPDVVDKALHDTDQFAMEAIPDMEQMMLFSGTMFFNDELSTRSR